MKFIKEQEYKTIETIEKQSKEIERLKDMDKILRNENINLKLRINKAIEILDIYGTSNYETADLLYSALRGSDKG